MGFSFEFKKTTFLWVGLLGSRTSKNLLPGIELEAFPPISIVVFGLV